jgi:ribosome biogenesis GTPase A
MAAEGTQQIFEVCKKLVGSNVDLSLWENKIKEETNVEYADGENVEIGETVQLKTVDTEFYQYERFNKGVLTIGCLGQPNVGKSSLMNAIMGKKVVSVSRTPGHTKHFQTIFVTPNVKLCDCPGLVFPSKVPKPLQVLIGSFPIAQLREPFSTVRFIG